MLAPKLEPEVRGQTRPHTPNPDLLPGLWPPAWEEGWSLSQGRGLETEKQHGFEVTLPSHISPDTRRAAPTCSPGSGAGFMYGESIPASTEGAQSTLHLPMDRFF